MSNKYNILSIDPAERTGWACSNGTYGLWHFKISRNDNFAMRLIQFEIELIKKVKEENINMIVFEAVSGRMPAAIMSHSKYVGIIELFCTKNNIPFEGFHAKTIKKFATGNGNCGKLDMIKAAIVKFKYRGKDDNVADAICLLNLVKQKYEIQ